MTSSSSTAAFLACAVEMVEALTIVLAVGVTRGWRSAIIGTAAALGALTVVVAALGPALAVLPIDGLRLFVGGLLLIFGLQWLRKAILRASGFKALHDEDAIFAEERRPPGPSSEGRPRARLVHVHGVVQGGVPRRARGRLHRRHVRRRTAQRRPRRRRAPQQPRSSCASRGSTVHRPLSQVPENTMKYAVGVMLSTFGMFWAGEGAGVNWPGSDASLIALLAFVLATSGVLIWVLRRSHGPGRTDRSRRMNRITTFGRSGTTSSSATTGASPSAWSSPSPSLPSPFTTAPTGGGSCPSQSQRS